MKRYKKYKNTINGFIKKIPFIKYAIKKIDNRKIIKRELEYLHNERDPKELKKITPPKGEKIEIHCAWVSEVFTPSNINRLLKALKRLKWDYPENNLGTKISLTNWVTQGRSHGDQSSWINGGIVLSNDDKNRFPGSEIRRAKLPNNVDYCILSLHNISSSVTIVTMQFIFNNKADIPLNKSLSHVHKTKIKRIGDRKISFIGPIHQKKESVKIQFDALHINLNTWFNKYFPGHFSTTKKSLPTISLVTTKKYKISGKKVSVFKDHYSDMLFDYDMENWTSKNMPELQLRTNINKKSLGVLFGNFSELTKNGMEPYGGKNREGLARKFNAEIINTMALWSIHHLLLSFEKQLSTIRDKTTLAIKESGQAIKNLNYIQSHFLSISTDVQIVSNSIRSLIKSKNNYLNGCMDFLPPNHFRKIYPDFLDLLKQNDEMRTESLIKQESQVNESITASGNLTSAIANLHTQQTMSRLTKVIIVLTIVTIILTILSILKDNPLLNQIIQKLTQLHDLVMTMQNDVLNHAHSPL